MVQFKLATLALLAFNALNVFADQGEVIIENVEEIPDVDDGTSPGQPMVGLLKVLAQAAFKDSDVFGVKLINGRPNVASFFVMNSEDTPVTVRVVGGALHELDAPSDIMSMGTAVRNLTSASLNTVVPPASNVSFGYPINMNMQPQDLRLILAAIVENSKGETFQVNAFNGTVSVVDAPISILDPQMLFLYLILAAGLAGIAYFVYTTWIKTLLPQQKKRPVRKPAPAKRAESASTTGYDESWISSQHLQRPEAKRVKTSTSAKSRSK